ncbi:mitochondrial carrier domain-containing protein [Jimgerdemannia flammicorona]|uniref:Mitochondrial carrier domain-containing protein n=1 Tax=Jimgerdemannia flammicorona TaxID=994334 RepID=A0A433DK05_9FUNG|nr:mitochondrial carrier domain-containing protein [Jimgerdemannia flammicorona]
MTLTKATSSMTLPASSMSPTTTTIATTSIAEAKPHVTVSSSQHNKELAAKFLFAGTGSVMGSFVTNPVDIVKVRLQLQGEGMQKAANQNFARVALNMFRNEGPLSFYNGVTAGMLREDYTTSPLVELPSLPFPPATYSTIRFGAYDWFKNLAFRASGGTLNEKALVTKIAAGLASGMAGAVLIPHSHHPSTIDPDRSSISHRQSNGFIRIQAYNPSPTPRYRSVFSAFAEIYRSEGLAGLYRGVGPTTARAALVTASQLATYDHTKHWLIGQGVVKEGLPAHLASSVIAGFACSITSAPVDTIKVRYMNQPFDSATGRGLKYTSSFECVRKTVALEGPLALYKG